MRVGVVVVVMEVTRKGAGCRCSTSQLLGGAFPSVALARALCG
jgi:hypothetical protein